MVELQCFKESSRLLIKSLLLLWIIAVAIECGDLTKRDVVHRIVLKSGKRSKAHKHHHHHHSYRPEHGNRESKVHKHRYSQEDHIDYDEGSSSYSHEDNRESRKNIRPEDKRVKNSIESTRESIRGNSYEDNYELRYKKDRPSRQNYHRFHKFNEDLNVDESRHPEPLKIKHNTDDDWATSIDDVPPFPEVNSKKQSKKFKTSFIDFTTSFPLKPPPSFQFSAYEPLYSPLPTLPNLSLLPTSFEYNKNIDYTPPQPLNFIPQLPVLQPKPVNQFTNLLPIQTSEPFKPNLSNNYEVNEKDISDVQPTSLSNIKSFKKVTQISTQKSGTTLPVNSTNSSTLLSGISFKNDIKKLSTTRSSKKKWRINNSK